MAVCLNTQLHGQVDRGFNYQTHIIDSISSDLELKIVKGQFDNPNYVLLSLKELDGTKVLEVGIGPDLISGAKSDSTGVFTQNKDDFILKIQGITPDKYKIFMQVLQEDGKLYFIKEEELNLWEGAEGN